MQTDPLDLADRATAELALWSGCLRVSGAAERGHGEGAAGGSSVKGGTDGVASSVASVSRVYEQVCRAWWAEIRSAVVWWADDWATARAKSVVRVNRCCNDQQ